MDAALETFAFARGDTLVAVASRRADRNTLLARAYVKARAANLNVKVLFTDDKVRQRFFEELVPAAGLTYDLFNDLDNESQLLDKADVVLLDDVQHQSADTVAWVVKAVRQNRTPLLVTSADAEGVPALAALKRRTLSVGK